MTKAKNHLDPCDEECKFQIDGVCKFGLRDTAGCYLDGGIEMKLWMSQILNIETQVGKVKYGSNLSEETKGGIEELEKISHKKFRFVFKGHEYTLSDSARNQGECPHCGESAPNDFFWEVEDDAFIGMKRIDKIDCVFCFECPNCFDKFFYHQSIDEAKEIMKNKELFENENKKETE